jgi:tRNA 2-thiouridine synthesizing protein A
MTHKLDTLGEICPIPLLKAKMIFKTMEIEDVLQLVTDHSCVVSGIIDYFSHYNCDMTIDEVINGVWEIEIKYKTKE